MLTRRASQLTFAVAAIGAVTLTAAFVTGGLGQDDDSGSIQGLPPQSGAPGKRAFEATERAMYATDAALPTAPITREPITTPRPVPTAFAAGPDVKACVAADLDALAAEGVSATGGQNFIVVRIGNVSDVPCRFAGPPDVQLLDANDKAVFDIDNSAGITCSKDSGSLPCVLREPSLLLLPKLPVPSAEQLNSDSAPLPLPGQALLRISWWSPRSHTCSGSAPLVGAIRLELPENGGDLLLKLPPELFSKGGIEPCRAELFAFEGVPVLPKEALPTGVPQ